MTEGLETNIDGIDACSTAILLFGTSRASYPLDESTKRPNTEMPSDRKFCLILDVLDRAHLQNDST